MFIFLFSFVFFAFLASFFNVIIDRIIRNEQFWKGRSYCENCKHQLSAKDLIPIFSYLALKGKCRYCKSPIPKSLVIIEFTTASVLTLVVYWFFVSSVYATPVHLFQFIPQMAVSSVSFLLFLLIIFSFIILIFFIDLKYQLIPDAFLYGLLIIYLVGLILILTKLVNWDPYTEIFFIPLLSHVASAASFFLFFGGLYKLSKGKAMGEGDVYLSAVLGLFLGLKLSVVMWFVSFLAGAISGVALVMIRKRSLKSTIPFGPFLVIGFVTALICGNVIINWYLRTLS